METITRSLGTGYVTYWSLSEHTNRDRLMAAWKALDLEEFVPEPRKPVACLKAALEDTFGGSQVLIRPLASKTGFVVVKEERGSEDNGYKTLFTAKAVGEEPTFTNFTEDTTKVLEAYRRHFGRLTNEQVGGALVKLMNHLGGTRLRPTGGIYWVNSNRADEWRAAARGIQEAAEGGASQAYFIEHELNADAIVAVKDAIVREITNETRRLRDEITSGELGTQAIETRKSEAAALKAKVIAYEGILAVTLDHLKEGLDNIQLGQAMGDLMLSALATPFPQDEEAGNVAVAD